MFIDELTPLFKELIQHPVSFMGGFVSGVLRLNLNDEPVKSWLNQKNQSNTTPKDNEHNNGKGNGPQSISID